MTALVTALLAAACSREVRRRAPASDAQDAAPGVASGSRDASAPRAADGNEPADAGARETGRDGGGGAGGGAGGAAPDASPDAPVVVDSGAPPALAFVDVAPLAGLDHVQARLVDCDPCDPESPLFTGGAAAGDFDGDGLVDLYVTRFDGRDLLYRNRGDGTFEEVGLEAGLDLELRSSGAGFADVDNDGDLDLYVTSLGTTRFHLFINDGAGTFSEEARSREAAVENPGVHQGFSVTFGDFDRDGWVDLHTCEWRPGSLAQGQPSNSRLLRNRGAEAPGHFEDVTSAAGVSLAAAATGDVFSFASSFTDLDGDGWPDLAVAADFGTSRLFWNNGNGTFTDGTAAAGVGGDENGMGSALGDYDGDGFIDWFVTSIHDPGASCEGDAGCFWGYSGNRLYRNNGDRTFSDHTDLAGVREGFWGWGAAFFDYDNDGDLDLVMTNGMDMGLEASDPFVGTPMRLWRNDGGTFVEVSAELGLTHLDQGRGLLVLDYDDDGDLDLLVLNHAAPPRLYRNDIGNANGWLRVRLAGTHSSRDAWGARVTLRRTAGEPPIVRELVGGNHFLGQSEAVLHFGLGPEPDEVEEVRIRWPRAANEQVLTGVSPNQTLVVTEPAPP